MKYSTALNIVLCIEFKVLLLFPILLSLSKPNIVVQFHQSSDKFMGAETFSPTYIKNKRGGVLYKKMTFQCNFSEDFKLTYINLYNCKSEQRSNSPKM